MPAPALVRPLTRTALLLVLATGLAGCGADEDPLPSGDAPVVARPSLPDVADGVTQDGVPQLVNVGYVAGRVTGAGGTVPLQRNTRVRLTVLTDTAETVLVRGYDARAQLTVDEPVQLTFIADRAGTFEVVLEQSRTVLTRLVVG